MSAYYNENDPFAAQWLRNLIAAGHIAPGEVDTRSIEDVSSDDLSGFQQCHFFAGIGVWSRALRDAGWPDGRVVWTGSCPCQPFSAAGKRSGVADERHLWPAFYHLIEECRPPVVLGEQVASKDGLAWLDTVQSDLEASGYAVGAADLCAAGVGAPHIRQRLWFVGVADAEIGGRGEQRSAVGQRNVRHADGGSDALGRLADSDEQGSGGRGVQGPGQGDGAGAWAACERLEGLCAARGVGDATGRRPQYEPGGGPTGIQPQAVANPRSGAEPSGCSASIGERPGPTNGLWRDADWLLCRDERWRPVRPGTFPLVNGAPSRVGRLRAYGNAIVAEAAREFIGAVMECAG